MTDILSLDGVVAHGQATTREAAIREAGEILVAAGAVKADYVDAMLAREATVSTYMGNFLAIPHGTNEAKDSIVRSALSLIRYDHVIDWGGEEVRFAVGIAGLNNEHLEILSKIAIIFSDEDDVQKLIEAPGAVELFALLDSVNEEE